MKKKKEKKKGKMKKIIKKIRKNKWMKINKRWKNMRKKQKRNEKLIGQVEKIYEWKISIKKEGEKMNE